MGRWRGKGRGKKEGMRTALKCTDVEAFNRLNFSALLRQYFVERSRYLVKMGSLPSDSNEKFAFDLQK